MKWNEEESSMADSGASPTSAEFVFRGTVRQLGASNLDVLNASDLTAVVHIEELLYSPAQFEHLVDNDVTVELRDEPPTLGEGDEAIFYTQSWLFGETLAVTEVSHEPVPPEAADAQVGRATGAWATWDERRIRERAAQADVILSGRVTDVRQPPALSALDAGATPGRRVSEHDPAWLEAVITVDRVV